MIKKHPAFTFALIAICFSFVPWFVKTIKAQNTVSQQQRAELYVPTGHTRSVGHVAFSPDGAIVASVGGYLDNTVKLWNVQTGQEVRTLVLEAGGTSSAAFSSDGKIIAAGDGDKIALWNVETGLVLRTLAGHTSIVTSVAFSPDGKILASKSNDETMKLWNVETGEQIKSLVYRDANARREVFSLVPDFKYYRDNYPLTKDKRFQIKIGDNGKLDLYELKTGKLLGSLVTFDQTDWAVVTPDGLFDGSPSAWKLLSWRLDSNTFRDRSSRSLLQ